MATYTVSVGEFLTLSADPFARWTAGVQITANVALSAVQGGPVWNLSVSERAVANSVQSVRVTALAAGTANVSLTDTPKVITNIVETMTAAATQVAAGIYPANISESVTATDVFYRVIPVDIFESVNLVDYPVYENHVISGAENVYRKISPKIEMQFPGFIREDGPQFVSFLKGYYQFAEQQGMAIDGIRGLQDNQDIDRSLDMFITYFRREFMPNIPKYVMADQRLMTKYIREFYRTRGSDDSFRTIFRAMFNKEIELYYPGQDILRASDGRWVRETVVRVGTPYNNVPTVMTGTTITGLTSSAVARVENIQVVEASGILVYDLTIQPISGLFVDGEVVADQYGNTATINNQLGSLTGINVLQGGAYHSSGGSYHEKGDLVEINGAASTEPAYGIIEQVSNKSAVEVVLTDGGSGYTKDHTQIIVEGGSGEGLDVRIGSWTLTPVSTAVNSDPIGPMAGVMIGAPNYFVSMGSNTATVSSKLTGRLTFSSTSNTVFGIGTSFSTQLQPGLLVRIPGQANTLRVHTVISDTSFVSVFRPSGSFVAPGADAYIRLAAANVYSTLQSAFAFSTTGTYSVNSISIINPGYNYETLPTIRIVDDTTSILNIDDGFGGFIGRNATVSTDYAPGSIVSIALTASGANFNRNELATIQNVTQGNSVIIQATPGNRGTTYRKLKTTFNGAGAPLVSGIKKLPGRYTDTKGFLSWNNKIQDNYYYQEFSYVVQINELVNKYREIIKNLVHPAGTKMFGTYTIRSGATLPFTLVQSSSNIHNVRNLEPVYATEIVSGTKITTDSSLGNEINPNVIITSFVSKDVSVGTEVATANGNPSVTVRFLGLGTANVATTDSFGGTGIYPGTSAESIATSDEQSAIGTYPGSTTEPVTTTHTQTAIGTYPAGGTANTAVSGAPSAIKIVLVNGTYVQVTMANNIASFYDSATISAYDPFVIDALNGTPRLVRIAKGIPWFANNALRANTGNIQVGGVGTAIIAAAIGSGSTTTYQVNAIFSNTFLTLRTNYVPVTSNATFAYSVG
jgi:hypothetical protein